MVRLTEIFGDGALQPLCDIVRVMRVFLNAVPLRCDFGRIMCRGPGRRIVRLVRHVGTGFEFPLTNRHDLLDNRIYADLI